MAQYKDPSGFTVTPHTSVTPLAVATLAGGLVALVVAGFFYLRIATVKADTETLNTRAANSTAKIAQLKDTAASLDSYNTIAKNLHILFDNQVRWEKVLEDVQVRLYKNMKVTSLQVGEDKSLTITAKTPNYFTYASAYAAFTSTDSKKVFGTVQVLSVSKDEAKDANGEVTFSVKAKLPAELLKADTTSSVQQ